MNSNVRNTKEFAEGATTESPGWWNTEEMPAWALSLVLHLAVLLILGSISQAIPFANRTILSSMIEEDISPEEFKFDTAVVDQLGGESTADMPGESLAAAERVGHNPQRELQQIVESDIVPVDMPFTEEILEPHQAELLEPVNVMGAVEHPGGVSGAIDRLTLEIAGSLKQRKTLVVWLFDVSPSVSKRRQEIVDRFENVYRQLGLLDVGADKALKTAVAAFGKETKLLTPDPVDSVEEVVQAVRQVDADNTGDENVFTAVGTVATKWLSYRTKMRRNMMIIIVTDEAGTDQQRLDDVIRLTKRHGIRCYVVGNAAPFGRKTVSMPWELEDGVVVTAIADQGPETFLPERLQLPFWGAGTDDYNNMSSGFGPYALTRLCAETNGIYFVATDTRGPHFDPAVMRDYQPEYYSPAEYRRRVKQNPTRESLIAAAALTWNHTLPRPQAVFPAQNDTVLRRALDQAQMPIADLSFHIDTLYRKLNAGEKGRDTLKESRWQAAYDLAMGRLLAVRARAFGYNEVLAEMKRMPKPFANEGSNQWLLGRSREISSGPSVKKLAKRATEYLKRVIDDHPGTPWEKLAVRELSQPMGWKWRERRVEPPRPAPANPNPPQRRIRLAEEQQRRERIIRQRGQDPGKPFKI